MANWTFRSSTAATASSGRWLFNKEPLSEWLKISNLDGLQLSMAKHLEILKKGALPESILMDVVYDTFQECIKLQQGGKSNPHLIPITKFYLQLRLTMIRRELVQRPDKKISYVEFPKWAFLYNLDLYRTSFSSLSRDRRLVFQTGSQQEGQTLGMVTNGLDPLQDYKVVCYITEGG